MQRYYGIEKPLKLTWRRFKALLFNLPADSAFISRVRAEWEDEERFTPSSVMDQMDRHLGRGPSIGTKTQTLDEYIGR